MGDEIDDRRRTAKSGGLMSAVVVIRRYGVEHGQVEMCVRVNTSWHDQHAACVQDLCIWMVEVYSYLGYFFTLNEDVGGESLAGGDESSGFDNQSHFRNLLIVFRFFEFLYPQKSRQ